MIIIILMMMIMMIIHDHYSMMMMMMIKKNKTKLFHCTVVVCSNSNVLPEETMVMFMKETGSTYPLAYGPFEHVQGIY